MQDHNLLSSPVTNDGFLSVGQSQNTQTVPRILNTDRCFTERAVTYVDCWLARNGYTGRHTGRLWANQLDAECDQRHQDLLSIRTARKVFGVEAIPYGLTLPAPLASAEVQQ